MMSPPRVPVIRPGPVPSAPPPTSVLTAFVPCHSAHAATVSSGTQASVARIDLLSLVLMSNGFKGRFAPVKGFSARMTLAAACEAAALGMERKAMSIEVRKLGDALLAAVVGVDISKPRPDDARTEVYQAFLDNEIGRWEWRERGG